MRHHSRGANRGFGPCRIEQRPGAGITRARRCAAHDHAEETLFAALRRDHDVEAGGPDEAGLHAEHAIVIEQQAVMAAVRLAAELGVAPLEHVGVFGEVAEHAPRQDRHVIRGCLLAAVRQPGRVAKGRVLHAHRARLSGHQLGEIGFRPGDILRDCRGDIVGGLGHQHADGVAHAQAVARFEADLRWRTFGRGRRHGQLRCQIETPIPEIRENDVKRHHLGKRCRIARSARIAFVQRLAGVGVDDDRGLGRRVGKRGSCRAGHDDAGCSYRTEQETKKAAPPAWQYPSAQHGKGNAQTHEQLHYKQRAARAAVSISPRSRNLGAT